MVKFGMPVWYGSSSPEYAHIADFSERSRRTLLSNVEKAALLGFDYVEISLDYPWPDIIHAKVATEAAKLGKALGVGFAFHAPWAGIGLAHPRLEMHEASMKVMKRCIRAAAMFGEPLYLNAHITTEEVPTLEFDEVVAVVLDSARSAVHEMGKECSRKGIEFTIENNPGMLFGLSSHMDFLLGHSSKAGLCLDVAHVARTSDELAMMGLKDIGVNEWISRFSGRIKTCHLNDYRGGRDNLAIGKGVLDIAGIVSKLGKKTRVKYVLLEEFWTDRKKTPLSDRLREKNLNMVREGFGRYGKDRLRTEG